MPSEETIQQIKIRNVIGEKSNLPSLNARSTLSSIIRAIITKFYGVPQLIHLYGALGLNKTLTLGGDSITSLYSDGSFLYATLYNTNIGDPGRVAKIDLQTFNQVSILTFDTGENNAISSFSDGTFLYVGCDTSPGKVVKIDLSTFTKVSTLTFNAGENLVEALFSDGTFLYAGLITSPGKVVKIDLATFTVITVLTLDALENQVRSLWSDGVFLYAGLITDPILIKKIDLTTFTGVNTLQLSVDGGVQALFSDGTYLYAGLITSPAIISKIDLSTFKIVKEITLAAGENIVRGMFSDGIYLYVGLYTTPGMLVKIDLSTFTKVNTTTFNTGENFPYGVFSDGTYLYTGLNIQPGKVIRNYIIPSADLHQRKIDLIDEQIHTGIYSIYPANAAGITITSGAGAYNKGNYTEVIPASTITTQFYITGLYIYLLTAFEDFEFDIATGAVASETIIATSSAIVDNSTHSYEISFSPPIKVPSNTRISVRCSDDAGSNIGAVKVRYKL